MLGSTILSALLGAGCAASTTQGPPGVTDAQVQGAVAPATTSSTPPASEAGYTSTSAGHERHEESPGQVVAAEIAARQAGQNARAFDDYWAPGIGATIDVTGEPLAVTDVAIGLPQPFVIDKTDTTPRRSAVKVAVSWTDESPFPGSTHTVGPWSGSVVLTRDGGAAPWRIVSFGDFTPRSLG